METYGLTLNQVIGSFNMAQIIILCKISECNANDMDKGHEVGKRLNVDNRGAAELFAGGII